MTDRDAALATLASIAASPAAIEASQAHLFAAIDALVAVYITADRSSMPPRVAASRSENAAWLAAYTHVEHRIAQIKRAHAMADKATAA